MNGCRVRAELSPPARLYLLDSLDDCERRIPTT